MGVDHFNAHATGLSSPGMRHFAITPSDTAYLPTRPRAIYCNVAGDAVIRDEAGTDATYALNAGQVIPFRGVRVLVTGTTATRVGWE